MVEVTTLGTGIVVIMIVAVAALFLVLTQHKYSAILLLASTIGGIVLDGILKLGFNRPRPAIFIPAVHTVSSSFPSGHAMSAAVVYSTVAYLAARLHKRRWAWRRWRLSRSSGLAAIPGFCSTSSPLRSRLRPARLSFTHVGKLGHFLHEDLRQLIDPVLNEHVAGTRECSSTMCDVINRHSHGGRSFHREHP